MSAGEDEVVYKPSKGPIRAQLRRGERECMLTMIEERLWIELTRDVGRAIPVKVLGEILFPGMAPRSQEAAVSDTKSRLNDVVGTVDLAVWATQGNGYRIINRPTVPTVRVNEE